MAGKPQAEKAVERFPELGCFAVAVRRIVYEKGMTLDNAIKKSGISKSAWFAGMAGSGGKPTRLPSLASFFAIADGLGITPEELIAAMRKEAEVREKSTGERAENEESDFHHHGERPLESRKCKPRGRHLVFRLRMGWARRGGYDGF